LLLSLMIIMNDGDELMVVSCVVPWRLSCI